MVNQRWVFLLLFFSVLNLSVPAMGAMDQCIRSVTINGLLANLIQQIKRDFDDYEVPESIRQESFDFIKSVNSGGPGGEAYYVETTLSKLKDLNDRVFKDKSLVTALINLHKSYFFKELNRLIEEYPSLQITRFSNFKGISLEVTGALSQKKKSAFEQRLEKAFRQANEAFFFDHRVTVLLREMGIRETEDWFHMGFGGATEGETAVATRAARALGLQQARYQDLNVQDFLEKSLRRSQKLHSSLASKLAGTKMMNRQRRFKLDFFVAMRKRPSKRSGESEKDFELRTFEFLRSVLSTQYPQVHAKMSTQLVKEMIAYIESVDVFSPSLLSTGQLEDVGHAPHGLIFLDFVALGARNLMATADAVVSSKQVRGAIEKSRENEKEVTKVFNQRKSKIKEAMKKHFQGEVKFVVSGDEFFIIPQRDERYLLEMLHHLSRMTQDYRRPNIRLAATRGNTKRYSANQLISFGERYEKVLRAKVLRTFGAEFSRLTHIGAIVLESKDPSTAVEFFTLMRVQRKIRKEKKKKLHTLIKDTIEELSKDEPVNFAESDSYLVDGVKLEQ